MLQGQKFQFGNYRLQNLMDAQMKYRISANKASGKPIEAIITPFDDQISNLEEDLNDTNTEYKLAQENPITQSYKNKVKSLTGMAKPEENLEEDFQAPDLETEMDNLLNPKPLSDPSEPITELQGNDIAPDDTTYQTETKYDSDAYPLTQKGDVINPGHSVLAQNDAKIMEWNKKNTHPGATGSWGEPEPAAAAAPEVPGALDTKPVDLNYMSEPESPPYVPPVDVEADTMLKNLDLFKVPPLKFKPDIYKAPKGEEFQADPFRASSSLGLIGRQIKDYGKFAAGGGEFGTEADTFLDKELNRIDKYKINQETRLENLAEKNRNADKDAYEKFKDDQEIKYKMATLQQKAALDVNKAKLAALKFQIQKNKGTADQKESYKLAARFSKLHHVSNYPERVDAFRNAMSAPATGSGDKDIIENLVKFIDPKGVIREGKVKFMTSALKNFSMNPDGTLNVDKFKRYLHVGLKGGFMTPQDRKELLEATVPMMQNFTRTYHRTLQQHQAIFGSRGWDPALLTPFELAIDSPEKYQAAMNKINADYEGSKDEIEKQMKTRSENPNVIENQGLIKTVKDYIFGSEPTGTKAPPVKDELDDWKKEYGI